MSRRAEHAALKQRNPIAAAKFFQQHEREIAQEYAAERAAAEAAHKATRSPAYHTWQAINAANPMAGAQYFLRNRAAIMATPEPANDGQPPEPPKAA